MRDHLHFWPHPHDKSWFVLSGAGYGIGDELWLASSVHSSGSKLIHRPSPEPGTAYVRVDANASLVAGTRNCAYARVDANGSNAPPVA